MAGYSVKEITRTTLPYQLPILTKLGTKFELLRFEDVGGN